MIFLVGSYLPVAIRPRPIWTGCVSNISPFAVLDNCSTLIIIHHSCNWYHLIVFILHQEMMCSGKILDMLFLHLVQIKKKTLDTIMNDDFWLSMLYIEFYWLTVHPLCMKHLRLLKEQIVNCWLAKMYGKMMSNSITSSFESDY